MHFNNTTILIIAISVILIVIGLVCLLSKKKDESYENISKISAKRQVMFNNFNFGGSSIQGNSIKLGWFLKEDLEGRKNILVSVSAHSNNQPYTVTIFDRNDIALVNLTQTSGQNAIVIPSDRFDERSFPMSVLLSTTVDTVIELNNFNLSITGTNTDSIDKFVYVPDYQPLTALGRDLQYPEGSYERVGRVLYPELKYVFN
jgi:hypothetical protein